MHNIIEIGQDYCTTWPQKNDFLLPNNALLNPQLLADSITDIPKGKITFLLNIAQTNVSLMPSVTIPRHLDSDKYINSHALLPDGRFWLSTIPSHISNVLLEMCRIKKIRLKRIQAIDTLEYRLANYCYQQSMANIYIFLPLKSGIHLITFDSNGVCSYYFFSNNPAFRENELSRIHQNHNTPPQNAIILSNDSSYDWLYDFNKGLIFDDTLKEKMISQWLG